MSIKAVIFDFGGVFTTSPVENFAAYERANNLPEKFIGGVIKKNHHANAWAKFERAEITLDEFDTAFALETAAAGYEISGRTLIGLLSLNFHRNMIAALEKVRAAGFKTGCITNNLPNMDSKAMMAADAQIRQVESIFENFDHIIESSKAGVRKHDKQAPEETLPISALTLAVEEEEESAMHPKRFIASSLSVDASNLTNDESRVDGSCVVESSENCLDVDTRDDVNNGIEAKHQRESEWLECQRRYEDEQWVEAMELREFAALEKKIADETRDGLAKAEDAFKKKHVTFEEPHELGDADVIRTPPSPKEDVGDVFEAGPVDEFRRKKENSEQKTSPMSGQKGFQKLKKMSAARVTKTPYGESLVLSTTPPPRRQPVPEQTQAKQRIAQAKSEKAPNKKVRRLWMVVGL